MQKRFYETDPVVNRAVQILFVFPEDFQAVIAKSLSGIAEKEFQTDQRMRDLKSLGTEKILAIHKSKRKGRHYDHLPNMHEAMNYLMILEESERVFICKQILELMTFIQEYLKTCKSFTTLPDTGTVEAIAGIYVKFGPSESKKLLQAMEQEFVRRINQLPAREAETEPERVETRVEGIRAEETGMRIRGDRLG